MPETKPDREVLKPPLDQYCRIAEDPKQQERKRLWAEHFAMRPVDRTPFSVYYDGMSATAWEDALGPDYLQTRGAVARQIETQLRKLLWLEEHVDDDTPKFPMVIVGCPAARSLDWGVPLAWRDPHVRDGAKGYDPPFADGIDISRLRKAEIVPDVEAGRRLQAEAEELVDGRLTVQLRYPGPGLNPFDIVVSMRGMEQVFLDVFDRPDEIHVLMDFITTALVDSVKQREAEGWINFWPEANGQVAMGPHRIRAYYPTGGPLTFADEWPYISAQTSAGLGPEQFAEFCQPYHERLDALCTRPTTYFHGCECLDQKMDVIQRMPNLKHFHVSPWTNRQLAVERLRPEIILETHSHPGDVFFGFSRDEIRGDVRRTMHEASTRHCGLYLSDIHSINASPDRMTWWAQCCREFAAK